MTTAENLLKLMQKAIVQKRRARPCMYATMATVCGIGGTTAGELVRLLDYSDPERPSLKGPHGTVIVLDAPPAPGGTDAET